MGVKDNGITGHLVLPAIVPPPQNTSTSRLR
jgi:hypothetical protein